MRILVLDPKVSDYVQFRQSAHLAGHTVVMFDHVFELESILAFFIPDLVVVNVNLRCASGKSCFAELNLARTGNRMRVVSVADSLRDASEGDLYKPISFASLAQFLFSSKDSRFASTELSADSLNAETLTVRSGFKRVVLTQTEFNILEILVKAKGQLVRREELLRACTESGTHSRLIDVHIFNIRQKLGLAAVSLVTVRGKGYSIVSNKDPNDLVG